MYSLKRGVNKVRIRTFRTVLEGRSLVALGPARGRHLKQDKNETESCVSFNLMYTATYMVKAVLLKSKATDCSLAVTI